MELLTGQVLQRSCADQERGKSVGGEKNPFPSEQLIRRKKNPTRLQRLCENRRREQSKKGEALRLFLTVKRTNLWVKLGCSSFKRSCGHFSRRGESNDRRGRRGVKLGGAKERGLGGKRKQLGPSKPKRGTDVCLLPGAKE